MSDPEPGRFNFEDAVRRLARAETHQAVAAALVVQREFYELWARWPTTTNVIAAIEGDPRLARGRPD